MKMKNNITLLVTILIFLSIFIFTFASIHNRTVTTKIQPEVWDITGVVRTSGLNIPGRKFQITDFGERMIFDKSVSGVYLETKDDNFQSFEGKCVHAFLSETKESSLAPDTYNRITVSAVEMTVVDFENCTPYQNSIDETLESSQSVNLNGVIARSTRQTPDIGYDYVINTTVPFIDSLSEKSSFSNSVIIHPSNNLIWVHMESTLGQKVNIQGYPLWGYAESRYILVTAIN